MEQTIEKMRDIGIKTAANAYREQAGKAEFLQMSFDERMGILIEREYLDRQNNKVKRLRTQAHLKERAAIEDLQYDPERTLKRAQIRELAQCIWIGKACNLIITGATGTGKTYLACAFGEQACRYKYRVLYVKMSEFAATLIHARNNGTNSTLITKAQKADLLILDEWLRDPLPQPYAREILDLLDRRYRVSATLFATQLPVAEWHQHITDPTLADAILDRVVHDAHRLQIQGPSMRRKRALVHDAKDG
jgi:DNA replication protein DnaC